VILATVSVFQLSVNRLPWVVVGLIVFVLTFIEIYQIPSDAIGDALLLVLTVLPLAVFVVCLDEFLIAATSKPVHWGEVISFGAGGLISGGYFLWEYLKNDTKQRKLLEKHKVFQTRPRSTVWHIVSLLFGCLAVLGSVALFVAGGWDLVQGSPAIGLGLSLGALLIAALERWPQSDKNPFSKGRELLLER